MKSFTNCEMGDSLRRWSRFLVCLTMISAVLFVAGCGGDVEQARNYLDNSKSKSALELLEPYVDDNPREASAWKQLGRAYFQEDQYQSASYAFELSQELSASSDPDVQFQLAKSEYRSGNYQSALREFRVAEKNYPKPAELFVKLGEVTASLGFRQDAKNYYSRALESDSQYIPALTNTAEMALEEGNVDRTRQYLNRALDANPGDSRPKLLKARLSLAENEPTRAQGILEPVVEKWPENPQVNLLLARAHDRNDNPSKAADHYRTVLGSRFESSSIHDEFGQFLMQNGQDTQALDHFNWALRMNKNNVDAYYHRAVLYDQNENPQAAIRDYRSVLDRNNNHVRALNNLGVIYLQQGQPQEALSLFNRALDVRPGYHLARINQARSLRRTDNEEQARQILEAVVQNVSEESSAYRQAQNLLQEWS